MAAQKQSGAGRTERIASAKVIILAQGLSVTASVLGFIGLILAYRALQRSNSSESTAQVPTIS